MQARYRLQNRHIDTDWEDLNTFHNVAMALKIAADYAAKPICYGMVRVVDSVTGEVVDAFAEGSGRSVRQASHAAPIVCATTREDIETELREARELIAGLYAIEKSRTNGAGRPKDYYVTLGRAEKWLGEHPVVEIAVRPQNESA